MSIEEGKEIRDYMCAYAHIWSGKYKPVDFQHGLEDFFNDPENNDKPLKEIISRYKKYCEGNNFPFFCIAIMPWAEEEYYNEHLKTVKDFEAKHKELFN